MKAKRQKIDKTQPIISSFFMSKGNNYNDSSDDDEVNTNSTEEMQPIKPTPVVQAEENVPKYVSLYVIIIILL